MAIVPGTRIGSYEITGTLGAGGMGEVHRARDLSLHRDVAIKTLPEVFLADPDRLARFEREAHTLAALNHPNIAHVHGLIPAAAGGPALVMELVDGEDLAQRLTRGAIPLDEALPIARQVADALQAAHEQGIVHRDLKPANVKVRPDGTVKVLDFGLAKAMDSAAAGGPAADLAHSPTFTSPAMTAMGMIMGTAAYMAPEQARGRAVDKRADIWAFGCLLFEMLTGRRAFAGDDVADTITSLMRDEPDWTVLPAGLSPAAERFLRRCFAKNPRERVQDAGDLRLALEGAFDGPAADARTVVSSTRGSRWNPAILGMSALALTLLAGAAGWWLRPTPAAPESRIRRFSFAPEPAVLAIANTNRDIAVSPDGRLVAYLGVEGAVRQLYVRALDSLQPTTLRRAERYYELFFSHDSRWIAFNDESDFTLRKIAVGGGPPVTIGTVGMEMLGATWGDDDTIVYATERGLWRVPGGGGTPKSILKPDAGRGELVFSWPVFLPGSKTVLYAVRSRVRFNEWTINALDLASGAAKTVVRGGTNPLYSLTGHLLYVTEQTLHAVPFDAAAVETRGDPTPVLDGIAAKAGGGANLALALDGTLVYTIGGEGTARRQIAWLDRAGGTQALELPPHRYVTARISPDGGRIVLDVRDEQADLWIWDIARQTLGRLTTFAGLDNNPLWTRDGRRIVYSSARAGVMNLFVQPADGTGDPQQILTSATADNAVSVTPDGTRVIFGRDSAAGTGSDLMIAPIDGPGREARPLVAGNANEANGEVSPDGRWLAYESDDSGSIEVYVRPFPNVDGGRWQISYGGGTQAAWNPDSRELFFLDGQSRVNVVRITAGTALIASRPQIVNQTPIFAAVVPRTYDVAPDGKRLLVIRNLTDATQRSGMIAVVENWTRELQRVAPGLVKR